METDCFKLLLMYEIAASQLPGHGVHPLPW
jgi:hypothetical protein